MTNYKALLAALLAFTGLATAHMEMTYPPPLLFKSNPNTSPDKVDYSMTSPLRADGSDFPCKGYLSLLNTPEGKAVASWTAGGTYNFTISGGAAHGGGSCQAALSVDGGRTFRVMHSYEGGCPGQGQSFFAFAVPGDVPATEQGVFAWTWFNNLGNREMYMNCAVVVIEGSSGGGSDRVSFDDRPGLFTANIGNGCRTVDSADVKYPDPGPDVDSNGSSTPPTGSCGAESSSGRGSPGSGGNAGSCSGTGKTWTPGNDWPSWFQSGTPKMAGYSYLSPQFVVIQILDIVSFDAVISAPPPPDCTT
ncbi:lytic polysaccharide monooxygenase [Parathielavia hyrcaniae]|uniref:Lytic polysaccharide monooxygenase n=1 Tax=Parathielavia hyrcaniae TaxID=113614 RepID=A0AAN6PR43_9PEZI|nr:lytic polysaccharide monooxygenase [Parathielavia hyrcaniae]